MFEVGRVCMKTAGRESGKYCIVIKKMDEGFVMVTGPKSLTSVKRRRCNINHLEPIEEMVKIKSDASDDDVLKAYQQASIMARLGLEKGKKPKAEKKAEPERKEKHEHKKEKKPKEHKPAHKERKVKHEKKPAKKPAKKEETRSRPKKAKAGKKTVKKTRKK